MTTDSKDNGKTSTTKHVPRPPRPAPEEIRYAPPSHPMFSGQIEVRFGKKSRASTGDGEEPRSALEDIVNYSEDLMKVRDLILSGQVGPRDKDALLALVRRQREVDSQTQSPPSSESQQGNAAGALQTSSEVTPRRHGLSPEELEQALKDH
jgi:hypothetical protein